MAGLCRSHIKFPEMKQDADPAVLEVAEASGGRLDLLDAAVERFAHGVGDPVANERQQPLEMSLEHLRLADHRLEAAANRGTVPAAEVVPRRSRQREGPEAGKHLLQRPGPSGPQRACLHVSKQHLVAFREIRLSKQPES